LGKKVEELLIASGTSVAEQKLSSVRQLSLPNLARALGGETAHWLFQLSAYGCDSEPVVPKIQHESASMASTSTTKSLTAFKSLPNSRRGVGHSVEEANPWFRLLATDLATRIQRDTARNNRFPRTCTLHYTKPIGSKGGTQSKSVRVSFPPPQSKTTEMVSALCLVSARTLKKKEGTSLQLTRIGFSATDFVQQDCRQSINRFFSSGFNSDSGDKPTHGAKQSDGLLSTSTLHSKASPTKQSYSVVASREVAAHGYGQTRDREEEQTRLAPSPKPRDDNSDLALARKLQAQYDREDQAWARLDQPQPRKKQRRTIDSFFASK